MRCNPIHLTYILILSFPALSCPVLAKSRGSSSLKRSEIEWLARSQVRSTGHKPQCPSPPPVGQVPSHQWRRREPRWWSGLRQAQTQSAEWRAETVPLAVHGFPISPVPTRGPYVWRWPCLQQRKSGLYLFITELNRSVSLPLCLSPCLIFCDWFSTQNNRHDSVFIEPLRQSLALLS